MILCVAGDGHRVTKRNSLRGSGQLDRFQHFLIRHGQSHSLVAVDLDGDTVVAQGQLFLGNSKDPLLGVNRVIGAGERLMAGGALVDAAVFGQLFQVSLVQALEPGALALGHAGSIDILVILQLYQSNFRCSLVGGLTERGSFAQQIVLQDLLDGVGVASGIFCGFPAFYIICKSQSLVLSMREVGSSNKPGVSVALVAALCVDRDLAHLGPTVGNRSCILIPSVQLGHDLCVR